MQKQVYQCSLRSGGYICILNVQELYICSILYVYTLCVCVFFPQVFVFILLQNDVFLWMST